MLLTTREIADLCAKYGLTTNTLVRVDGVFLFVEISSIVFNNYSGNKMALLVLRKAAGTCYRLKYVYNKLAFIPCYRERKRESILSLINEHEDEDKYEYKPHTMAELELMVKKCVEHVRLNEPNVKAFEAKKRLKKWRPILLLTTNEIKELCHKYGLSYVIEDTVMIVTCDSFVFDPRKKR